MSNAKSSFEMKGQFTADNTAIVLIDYQVGTLQLVRSTSSDVSLRNGVMLATAAVKLKMPLVLTSSMEDNIQGEISPALAKVAPEAYKARVKRAGIVNAWADPNFREAVASTGRKNLIMGGITTDICLIFPAISAVQLGYSVHAVLDASGSAWDLSEQMARERMKNAGVVLTATNTSVAELVQDWSSPAGKELQPLINASMPMMQAMAGN